VSETTIAWCDYSFNPWWGCVRVSPGCEHCYAEAFSHRLGLDLWGPTAGRRFFDERHWSQPLKWAKRAAKGDQRHRVFCASMADVFEASPILAEQRLRLWDLIAATPELTWQLLTKRPENIRALAPREWVRGGFPANVWLLTTAEDQTRFDARWPFMAGLDAVVKGVSYEPALGPIDFGPALRAPRGIDWVIAGGESGSSARPFYLDWARETRVACQGAGVAYFLKQVGSHPHCGTCLCREVCWCSDQLRGVRGKGDNPAEWPADLRVREFPCE